MTGKIVYPSLMSWLDLSENEPQNVFRSRSVQNIANETISGPLQNDRERPDAAASIHGQKQEAKGSQKQQPFGSAGSTQVYPLRAVNQGVQRDTVDQTRSMAHELLHDAVLTVSTYEMALRRTANEKDFASQTFIVSENAEITSDASLTHWQARETDLNVIRQDGPKSAQMPSIFDTANI